MSTPVSLFQHYCIGIIINECWSIVKCNKFELANWLKQLYELGRIFANVGLVNIFSHFILPKTAILQLCSQIMIFFLCIFDILSSSALKIAARACIRISKTEILALSYNITIFESQFFRSHLYY